MHFVYHLPPYLTNLYHMTEAQYFHDTMKAAIKKYFFVVAAPEDKVV